jgi:hypothetical protein
MAAGVSRRLEFELGAWFEGACGLALVLALSQMLEHGLGPFGRADMHPRRNPLDRQGRFAPQPSKFPLLTLLDAPDFTRLATGNPKSGPALPPGSGASRGDARRQTGSWFRSLLALDVAGLPRSMRMEYPGATYHVMDRGDRRESGSRLAGKEF